MAQSSWQPPEEDTAKRFAFTPPTETPKNTGPAKPESGKLPDQLRQWAEDWRSRGPGNSVVADTMVGLAELMEGTRGQRDERHLSPEAFGALGLFANVSPAAGTGRAIAEAAGLPAARAAEPSSVRTLMESGVPLTPGQMAGKIPRIVESKATSIPITGDAIAAAQRRGIQAFNIAAADRALAPIGVKLPRGTRAGEDAIGAGQAILDAAYGDLLPKVRFKLDKPALDDIESLRGLTREMPPGEQAQFDAILQQRVLTRMGSGKTQPVMDGQTLKQVESELTQKIGQLKANKQYQLSDAVRQLRETIRENLERQNPEQAAALQKINRAYAMFSRIEDASIRRPSANGVFTPADLLAEIKANAKRTGNKKAYARGDSDLKDFASAGQDVLPAAYPDSGSIGRMALTGGLLEMMNHPEILLGLGGAAAPYTRPGISLLNAFARAAPATRSYLAGATRPGGQVSRLMRPVQPMVPTITLQQLLSPNQQPVQSAIP